jgi:hypothetical protein
MRESKEQYQARMLNKLNKFIALAKFCDDMDEVDDGRPTHRI